MYLMETQSINVMLRSLWNKYLQYSGSWLSQDSFNKIKTTHIVYLLFYQSGERNKPLLGYPKTLMYLMSSAWKNKWVYLSNKDQGKLNNHESPTSLLPIQNTKNVFRLQNLYFSKENNFELNYIKLAPAAGFANFEFSPCRSLPVRSLYCFVLHRFEKIVYHYCCN